MSSSVDLRTKAFTTSQQGLLIRQELINMVLSKKYNTVTSYSVLDVNGLSFVDKQMRYMSRYPTMNHMQYVANLKVMTRIS